MSGFSAISAGNGWLITAIGISVVFTGLASLALVIFLFPRILAWWSGAQTGTSLWQRLRSLVRQQQPASEPVHQEPVGAADIEDAEEALRLITSRLGEPFKLPRLLELAGKRGLPKPHSTINRLILKGRIVGGRDGLFRWKHSESGESEVRPDYTRESIK